MSDTGRRRILWIVLAFAYAAIVATAALADIGSPVGSLMTAVMSGAIIGWFGVDMLLAYRLKFVISQAAPAVLEDHKVGVLFTRMSFWRLHEAARDERVVGVTREMVAWISVVEWAPLAGFAAGMFVAVFVALGHLSLP